jgi:hypothetical protein
VNRVKRLIVTKTSEVRGVDAKQDNLGGNKSWLSITP